MGRKRGTKNSLQEKKKNSQLLQLTDWTAKPKKSILKVTVGVKASRKKEQKMARDRGTPSAETTLGPGHRARPCHRPGFALCVRGGPCLKMPPLIFFLIIFFIFYFRTDSIKGFRETEHQPLHFPWFLSSIRCQPWLMGAVDVII